MKAPYITPREMQERSRAISDHILAALDDDDRALDALRLTSEVVSTLRRYGAATDLELAVRTLRQPDEVRWELLRLQIHGRVRPHRMKGCVVWQLTREHTYSWERD